MDPELKTQIDALISKTNNELSTRILRIVSKYTKQEKKRYEKLEKELQKERIVSKKVPVKKYGKNNENRCGKHECVSPECFPHCPYRDTSKVKYPYYKRDNSRNYSSGNYDYSDSSTYSSDY